ncbi:hypothetical protein RHMOL_Rhmol09G0115600 [Rhododendron molle]|uniref:Uncharacterized protein n=1 Tax=Rhododendron molle TaxID=49168 RepID=A0ACC0MC28_RHOML|nr:hypothetical protein RHMOL_Rhmol09G0115600 [Rhododendron molle]
MEGENNLVYGACVRNYAAELGRYVLDGCGEFARDSVGSRYCEACGCDKNFHLIIPVATNATDGTKLAIHGGNNGGKILRQSSSEESVLTMVIDDDDDKVNVEVNNTPPGNVDEGSTATSGSKKKQNKNKKK